MTVEKSLRQRYYGNIFARIPLQSPPYGGDSFPPGEAIGAQHKARLRTPRQSDKLQFELFTKSSFIPFTDVLYLVKLVLNRHFAMKGKTYGTFYEAFRHAVTA